MFDSVLNKSPSSASRSAAQARSVLIALDPPSFIRLIGHLLHGRPEFRIVGRCSKSGALARAGRLAPDVIIANTRPGAAPGDILAGLKRSSPTSTLIVLTHAPGQSAPQSPEAADVCLPEEAVVRRLLPLIRKLGHPRRGSSPSSLRSRTVSAIPEE